MEDLEIFDIGKTLDSDSCSSVNRNIYNSYRTLTGIDKKELDRSMCVVLEVVYRDVAGYDTMSYIISLSVDQSIEAIIDSCDEILSCNGSKVLDDIGDEGHFEISIIEDGGKMLNNNTVRCPVCERFIKEPPFLRIHNKVVTGIDLNGLVDIHKNCVNEFIDELEFILDNRERIFIEQI